MKSAFDPAMYSFTGYAIPTLLTALATLALGLTILFRERRRSVGVPFALLCFSATVWLFSITLMYLSATPSNALFWARAGYLGIPFIPAAAYQFASAFLRLSDRARRFALLFWLVSLFFAFTGFFSNLVIERVERFWFGYYGQVGALGKCYVLYLVVSIGFILGRFALAYRRARPNRERRRIEAFLIAFAVAALALLDYVAAFGLPLYPFGYLAVLFFIIFSARTVWIHGLVDFAPRYAPAQILDTMQGSVLALDLEGKIRVANRAACEMLAYEEKDLIGAGMGMIIESPLNIGRASDTLLRGGTIRDRAMVWRTKGGSRIEVAVSGSMLRDEQGDPEGIVYVALDISDRKRAEQIEYQAHHDALTGLPNRIFFKNRLTFELDSTSTHEPAVAVMFLDLDGFKVINETFGHTMGDELLQAVARRLKGCLRERDSVARLGGDEFCVLLRVRTDTDIELVADKILKTIALPFLLEEHELYVTTSIGVALHPRDGEDAETLLKNADNAMYAAKDHGRNNYQLCGPGVTDRSRDRLFMERHIRRGLERGEFVLHYQPIVDLKTAGIVGVEALIRWQDPEHGLIPPNAFIGVAEETRLIIPLGEWALRQACEDLTKLHRAGFPHLRVAVNLSAHQFQHRDLARTIRQALESSGLQSGLLELEITETVAMQNADLSVNMMQELKDMGVLIAIDDFGTGYSSLSYLKRFPIDTVKLDQSFIQEMVSGTSDAAIVSAVIAMAHALNLKIVAEGVETREQLQMLCEKDCEEMQGFLVSRALPIAEIEQFLRKVAGNAFSLQRTTLDFVPGN